MDLKFINDFVEDNLLKRDDEIDAVFLVGSFARGEENASSDIDLMIVTKKKLSDDQQDNMANYQYKNREFSLLYTNFELLSCGVKEEIPSIISFIKDAKVIYDTKNLCPKIKALIYDFSFSYDLEKKIKDINELINFIQNRSDEEKNFIYLMEAIDLAREVLCSKNDPYMAVKKISNRLRNYSENYASAFDSMWKTQNVFDVFKIFKEQIDFIENNLSQWICKNKKINLFSRIHNAKEALEKAKNLLNDNQILANQIMLTESYYLFRGVMEYLGYDFNLLNYEKFFCLLESFSKELCFQFKRIWKAFNSLEIEKVLKVQISILNANL